MTLDVFRMTTKLIAILLALVLLAATPLRGEEGLPSAPDTAIDAGRASGADFFTFFARHQWEGCHIYQSDGTARGTRRIFELWMGQNDCYAGVEMLMLGGRAVMIVNWAAGWSTTQPGVFRLRPGARPVPLAAPRLETALDLRFAAMESDGQALFIVFTPRLIPEFTLVPELWRTDGTSAGTRRVMELRAEGETFDYHSIVAVFQLRGRWLMLTDNLTDTISSTRGQLFELDLEARQVRSLFRFRPDAGSLYWTQAHRADSLGRTHVVLGPLSDRMVFFRRTPDRGIEPWVTDGTRAGTQLLLDVFRGPVDGIMGAADGLIPFGEQALFVGSAQATGDELWITEGTPESTRIVSDINPGSEGSGIDVDQMAILDGRLYFTATSRDERGLWVSDGTPAGTRRVAATIGGERLLVGPRFHTENPSVGGRRPIAAVDGRILFSGSIQRGDCSRGSRTRCIYENAIFRYDPTEDSVEQVVQTTQFRCQLSVWQQQISYREIGGEYQSLMAFGNALLFSATDRRRARPEPQCWNYDQEFDIEPWILHSDGPAQVADIARRRVASRPSFIGSTFCDGLC